MFLYDNIIEGIYKFMNIHEIYKMIRVSKRFYNVYRKTEIQSLLSKAENKHDKLKIFVNYYKYLPKQGSKQWLEEKNGNELKPPTVGGSEMALLINNPRELADKKLNPKKFNGNIHTRWGNIFEEILSSILDYLFKAKSVETGSIPGLIDENGNIIQAYSPDRLRVINKYILRDVLFGFPNEAIKCFESEFNNLFPKLHNDLIVLDELKCPSTRIPDGKIPKEYIYQPPTGACTIPIVDFALFINACFRKCSFKDFGFNNKYDIEFHNKDIVNNPKGFGSPIFIGMIGIYDIPKTPYILMEKNIILETLLKIISICNFQTFGNLEFILLLKKCLIHLLRNNKWRCSDPNEFNEIILDAFKSIKNIDFNIDLNELEYIGEFPNIMDYGNLCLSDTNDIFENIVNNRHNDYGYHAYYTDFMTSNQILNPILKSGDDQCKEWMKRKLLEFDNYCRNNNYEPIGFIPWKMFKICIIPVFHDPDFLNNYKDNIYDFIEKIQHIKTKAVDLNISKDKIYEFYKEELNIVFNPKRERIKKINIYIETEKLILSREELDFFNNL